MDTEVPEVVSKINETNLGIAAVVDTEGILRGSITDGDIRRAILTYPLLHERTAKEIMRDAPRTIGMQESLRDALRLMETYKITSLFVVNDGGVLLGLIHMHQILDDTEW